MPKGYMFQPLLIALLAVLLCSSIGMAKVIDADTVWSGDVHVSEKIVVDRQATLQLLPGTRVTFDPIPQGVSKGGGRLIVFGRLIAQGHPDKPIVFTSAAIKPQANDWEGVRFERANLSFSYLSHSVIEYAQSGVNGRNSFLQIDNTRFSNNGIGVSARSGLIGSVYASLFSENDIGLRYEHNDSLKLINCAVQNNRKAGILCSNSAPSVQNNTFIDNNEDGIVCLRGSSPLVEDNLIRGHKHGIRAEMISSPTVLHNEIVDNDTAIKLERLSFTIVEFNLIQKNRVGIFCQLGGYPHIHNNNIVDNREFAIDLGPYQSIVVAKATPFDQRAKMNLSTPDNNGDKNKNDPELVTAFPHDGSIDAHGNWWGEESLQELRSGKSPNISLFEDGYDVSVVDYQGNTYPRDRVGYSGWSEGWIDHSMRRDVQYSGISGRVIFNGGPSADARVHVYHVDDENLTGDGITFSSPTGPDGVFSLPLKPGHYKLVARKAAPNEAVSRLVPEIVSLPAIHSRAVVKVAAFTNLDINLTNVE